MHAFLLRKRVTQNILLCRLLMHLMHAYSINSAERTNVPFVLAAISIISILVLKNNVQLPSWIPVPSVFAVYGLLHLCFNKWIWRFPFLQRWGWISTPDLNGDWLMLSRSSLNNYEKEYRGNLTIKQTWTTISLLLDGEKFSSKSTMAGIEIETDKMFSLKWEYLSQKKPSHSDEDYMHTGMTRVRVHTLPDPFELRGDYFTDKSRHNYGSIHMTQIKKA